MKLNCDLGENEANWLNGQDKILLQRVDMINISCGVHAGNPDLIKETIESAKAHAKEIGAHPSYNDLENFGRISLNISSQELYESIYAQMRVFQKWSNGKIDYVKPHGALYHDCMKKPEVISTLIKVLDDLDLHIPIMLMAGFKYNYPLISEAFLDRRYKNKEELVPRSMPNSLLSDEKEVLKQYIAVVEHGIVIGEDQKEYKIVAESLCIHSDTPNVLRIAEEITKYKGNKPD